MVHEQYSKIELVRKGPRKALGGDTEQIRISRIKQEVIKDAGSQVYDQTLQGKQEVHLDWRVFYSASGRNL